MGSSSDYPVMKEAEAALDLLGVSHESVVLSAHRTPDEAILFAKNAQKKGYKTIIAGAGGAAHLPGVLAAFTLLPVIGVPIASEHLHGQDALYSIVQMPKGIPVATVAIGNAWNAGLLAAHILACADPSLYLKLKKYRESLRKKVLSQKLS